MGKKLSKAEIQKRLEEKRRQEREAKIKRNKRIFLIVIASLLTAVLIFGAVYGILSAIKRDRATAIYEGITIDKGVTNYLAATYKSSYMKSIGEAYDTPEFWATKPATSNKTYGESLKEDTEEYIRSVIIGAYLFERYSELSRAESNAIDKATREILDYVAGNDKKQFNSECAPMGFDYDDFCLATELIYKAERAKVEVYGEGGILLDSSDNYKLCNSYFEEYSRVKILYIPTLEDLVRDKDGKFELDADGRYLTQAFTEEEYETRIDDIERLRELIAALETDADEQISPTYFDSIQAKYNYSAVYNKSGYYFAPNSEYTARFAGASSEMLPDGYREIFYKQMSDVVKDALSMGVGEYREIESEYGVCFVYKCANEEYAYTVSANRDFFHDFFSDAADYLYNDSLRQLIKDVQIQEKYYEMDVIALPYNSEYVAKVEVN